MFGKDAKKKELIGGLAAIFASLQQQHQISAGDFPSVQRMQEQLQYHDFSKFPLLKPKLLEGVDRMLASDIARLMTLIPKEEEQRADTAVVKVLLLEYHCYSALYGQVLKLNVMDQDHDKSLVLVSVCLPKRSNALSVRSPVMDKESAKAAHWLWGVFCVPFSTLSLVIR